jgi:LuxR family transcriptional regulator, maltose regulon positive regulatory protein
MKTMAWRLKLFHHAAAGNDVERAERLIEGQGVPLQFRGAVAPVLNWLESLSTTVLDASPSLWVTYATALFFVGQHTAVEQKLLAAEAALQGTEPDDRSQDVVGRIASIRATLAVIQHDMETIIAQSRRALEYLNPDNLTVRTAATYTPGYAYQLQGDRAAASRAYTEVIFISKSFADSIYTIAATTSLGQVQEADNQLPLAARTYRRVLQLAGDPPRTIASERPSWPGPYFLRMGRPGCCPTARATIRPTDAADRKRRHVRSVWGVSRPPEACAGRCVGRGRYPG